MNQLLLKHLGSQFLVSVPYFNLYLQQIILPQSNFGKKGKKTQCLICDPLSMKYLNSFKLNYYFKVIITPRILLILPLSKLYWHYNLIGCSCDYTRCWSVNESSATRTRNTVRDVNSSHKYDYSEKSKTQ